MRILQVIPYFTPKRGGDVNVCYNISKNLVKRGHEVTILTTDFEFDYEFAKSVEMEGVHVIFVHCIANISLFLFSPSIKNWLKNNIKNFDIIHMHEYRSYQNVVVSHYSNDYNIPYILQSHGDLPIKIEKQRLKKLFDLVWGNNILKKASHFISVSKEESDELKNKGLDIKKISIIYNGMDVHFFQNLPEYGLFRKKYNINDKMILYIGRIHKSKGIDFAIEAFSKLTHEMKYVSLIIVGSDSGYKVELEKLIAKLNVGEKVKFIGFIDEKEKLSALVDADLFIHTVYYMGGVGIAPLEAILCNTPVIVTEECGEIIKKANCGFFVKYNDINDLKEKMRWAIENPEQGKKIANDGRNYILKNLAWDDVTNKYQNIYNKISRF